MQFTVLATTCDQRFGYRLPISTFVQNCVSRCKHYLAKSQRECSTSHRASASRGMPPSCLGTISEEHRSHTTSPAQGRRFKTAPSLHLKLCWTRARVQFHISAHTVRSPTTNQLLQQNHILCKALTMPRPTLNTPLCELLGIEYPILLAGMARTSSGPLAAAVSNAGGLGTIGGLGYTPKQMREIIHEIKANLADPKLPFGVDLALPQVGGSARKTNHDYTHGQLDDLISVVIEEKAKLFVSAVGVPPEHVIKRLHDAGILVMSK